MIRAASRRVCVVCSVVSMVILNLSGLRPIFSLRIMGVGPQNIRVCFPVFQPSKFRGPPPIMFWGNIGCWPLKLKITKDARLHATRTRQKSGPDQTSFWVLYNRKPGKIENYNRGQLYCTPLLSTCPPKQEVFGLSPPLFRAARTDVHFFISGFG